MKEEGCEIRIVGYDRVIICHEDETILQAFGRHNLTKIPVGCRRGGCGICKIRIIEGEFETGKMSVAHVSLDERERNFSLACKTYPKSKVEFEIVEPRQKIIDIAAYGAPSKNKEA
jgi:ferredoxin